MKRVMSIIAVLICSSIWADAQAQTIADMARRERAKREAAQKQNPQQKSVPITNSKLKPTTPTVEVVDTSNEPGGQATTATTPTAKPVTPSTPAVTAPISTAAAAVAATAPTPAGAVTPGATVSTAPTTPAAPPAPAASTTPPPPANEPPARDEKWWRQQFEAARADVRRAENEVAVAELELNAANRDYLTTSFDPDGRGPAAIAAANKKLDGAKKHLDDARSKVVRLDEQLRQAGAPAAWAR